MLVFSYPQETQLLGRKSFNPYQFITMSDEVSVEQIKSTTISKPKVSTAPRIPALVRSKQSPSPMLEKAQRAKQCRSGRISVQEYRKVFLRYLLVFVIFCASGVFLCAGAGVVLEESIDKGGIQEGLLAIILSVGLFAIGGIVFYFIWGGKAINAQIQRLNDLGMNGKVHVWSSQICMRFACVCSMMLCTGMDVGYMLVIGVAFLLVSLLWDSLQLLLMTILILVCELVEGRHVGRDVVLLAFVIQLPFLAWRAYLHEIAYFKPGHSAEKIPVTPAASGSRPGNLMAWSVINLILAIPCCWFYGISIFLAIFALSNSKKVDRYANMNNLAASCTCARRALVFNIITTVILLPLYLIALIAIIAD